MYIRVCFFSRRTSIYIAITTAVLQQWNVCISSCTLRTAGVNLADFRLMLANKDIVSLLYRMNKCLKHFLTMAPLRDPPISQTFYCRGNVLPSMYHSTPTLNLSTSSVPLSLTHYVYWYTIYNSAFSKQWLIETLLLGRKAPTINLCLVHCGIAKHAVCNHCWGLCGRDSTTVYISIYSGRDTVITLTLTGCVNCSEFRPQIISQLLLINFINNH